MSTEKVLRKPVIRQFELVEKVKRIDPSTDEDLVNKAYVFCMKVHGQQLRASGDPYFFHPLEVANILADMKLDYFSIITALLHDTIEDTLTTIEEVELLFGKEIASLVDGVTKLSKLEIRSSSSPQAENFRKLFLAMSNDIRVLLVKLADRVHNMRTLHYIKDESKRKRIAKETIEIYAPLASRIGIMKFRDELENYSFEHLYPDEYKNIMDLLAGMPHPQELFEKIIDDITSVLEKANLKAQIYGREKTPYSIWLKIKKRNITFDQLADLMAFRIIVDDLQECYQTLGVIHSAYAVVPGKFKDYISTPKPNGYQSLHTVIIGPLEQKIEIQIRTKAMHEVCELGVAAHWHYKQEPSENIKLNIREGKQYSWVRNLLEILENADNPDEFLEHTKLEMFDDQVFCFTPKGDLISLPKGASALDFAYCIHGDLGNSTIGVKINGKQSPLRTELQNGDQVLIITSKQQTPSPTWERFVVTGKAKAQIRKYIRSQKQEQFKELGYKLIRKYLLKENLHLEESELQQYCKHFSYEKLDDFLVAIGEGVISGKEIAKFLKNLSEKQVKEDFPEKLIQEHSVSKDSEVLIQGLIPGMAIHLAGCCHPMPGDLIVGVIHTGTGVTIHTSDCSNIKDYEKENLLDLSWGNNASGTFYYDRINVTFSNTQGALALITNTISKTSADINNLKILNRSSDFWEVAIDVGVKDREHFQTLQASLRTLKIVSTVSGK